MSAGANRPSGPEAAAGPTSGESGLEDALARVQAAIEGLDAAARDEFIQPGSFLGSWSAAVKVLCETMLALERRRATELQGYLAAVRGMGETWLEAGRVAIEEARMEARKIDRYIAVAEAEVAKREAESIGRIAKGLADQIKGVMVIRAKAYNRRQTAGLAGIGTLAVSVVLAAGVVLDRVALADARPEAAWRTCLERARPDATSGRTYCVLEVLPNGGGTR